MDLDTGALTAALAAAKAAGMVMPPREVIFYPETDDNPYITLVPKYAGQYPWVMPLGPLSTYVLPTFSVVTPREAKPVPTGSKRHRRALRRAAKRKGAIDA